MTVLAARRAPTASEQLPGPLRVHSTTSAVTSATPGLSPLDEMYPNPSGGSHESGLSRVGGDKGPAQSGLGAAASMAKALSRAGRPVIVVPRCAADVISHDPSAVRQNGCCSFHGLVAVDLSCLSRNPTAFADQCFGRAESNIVAQQPHFLHQYTLASVWLL